MTISAETDFVEYVIAGTANEKFVVPFPFFDREELFVYMGATEGTAALQVLGTNYSVSGGEGDVGSVTAVGTWTAGGYLGIFRRTPATQTSDYLENDPFPAEAHEDALDRLALGEQASLRLDEDDARLFDARDRQVGGVAAGTASDHAVNLAQLQAASLTPGSLPTILPGDIGKSLIAVDDSPQLAAWGTPLAYMPPSPAGPDVGKVLTVTGAGAAAFQSLPAPSGATFPFNFLVNGQFLISQRAGTGGTYSAAVTYFAGDGRYCLDRVILLLEGADNSVHVDHQAMSGLSNPIDGATRCIKLTVQAAGAGNKMGIFMPIENALTRRLRASGVSSTCSLRFSHRTTTGAVVRNIRAAVLSWSGAADSIVRDPVSVWGAEGTDPTWAGAWNNIEDTPGGDLVDTDISVAVDDFGDVVIQGIVIDSATCNNLGVVVWVDDKDLVAGDVLYLADFQLEAGSVSNNIIPADPAEELIRCQRSYCKSYDQAVAVGANSSLGAVWCVSAGAGVGMAMIDVRFPVTMRTAPSVTLYHPLTGAGNLMENGAGTDIAAAPAGAGDGGCRLQNTAVTVDASQHFCHYDASADL